MINQVRNTLEACLGRFQAKTWDLSCAALARRFDCAPPPINAAVSVYADGSVTVTHGGIECGQGLSTKVKQVCFQTWLRTPVEHVISSC